VLIMETTIFGREAPLLSRLATERGIAAVCDWDYMAARDAHWALGRTSWRFGGLPASMLRGFSWGKIQGAADPAAGSFYSRGQPPYRSTTKSSCFSHFSASCASAAIGDCLEKLSLSSRVEGVRLFK